MSEQKIASGKFRPQKKTRGSRCKKTKKQNRPSGVNLDVHNSKIDVDEQIRLYEEAQCASKQTGEGQCQSNNSADTHTGGISNSLPHRERHDQPLGYQQSFNVDPSSYGFNAGQQQSHDSPVPLNLYQNQQRPMFRQEEVVRKQNQQSSIDVDACIKTHGHVLLIMAYRIATVLLEFLNEDKVCTYLMMLGNNKLNKVKRKLLNKGKRGTRIVISLHALPY